MTDEPEKIDLSSHDLSFDQTADTIITKSLTTLSKNNPKAYKILCTLDKEGFFEKPQSKIHLKQIAYKLLDTIQAGEVIDEN